MKIVSSVHLTENRVCFGSSRADITGFSNLNELRCLLLEMPWSVTGDLDDFGRGSSAVRFAQLGVLLLAGDYGSAVPDDCAIFGWNGRGCLAENIRYFDDFVSNGKVSGRGNLFVATLPTIPCCEAAITLGIHGHAAYFHTDPSTEKLFRLISCGNHRFSIAVEINQSDATLLLLENTPDDTVYPDCNSLKELFFSVLL